MAYLNVSALQFKRALLAGGIGALALAMSAVAVPALAQQAAGDQPAAPAAADGAAAPAAGDAAAAAPAAGDAAKPAKVNWVKICDKRQIPDPAAKDPKTAKPVDRGFCVTQHEQLDGRSGTILVSAAVREDEGQEKKGLLITVPLGVIMPAGVHIFFDDEKDEKKVIGLPYEACLQSGCTAEVEATPEILDMMGKAKDMHVIVVSVQGIRVPLKVPMGGFATVMAGKPTDTAKYVNARNNAIMEIRERIFAKQKAAQAAAQEAIKGVQEDQAATKDAGAAPADPNAKATTGN